MSQSRARIRKLPLHDHMTHVAKIDILTGHEEIVTLHLILKIIFHSLFIEKKEEKKHAFSQNLQLIMKVYNIV